jgi:flagellar motor switch protein FliN/FliY
MAELNTDQRETLGILGEVVSDSTYTVLSMLLGQEVDLMPLRSDFLQSSEIAELNWEQTVITKARFNKGVEGTIVFFFSLAEITKIVDLMLGGDGEPASELNEDSSDALGETMNQILGSSSQTLTEKSANATVSVGQAEVIAGEDVAQLAKEHLSGSSFAGVEFSLDFGEKIHSKMFLGLDETLLSSMNQLLHRKEEAPPAPAPTPAPAASVTHSASAPTTSVTQAMPMAAPVQHMSLPAEARNIELLMDIELPVVIRIGKTELLLQDILKLTPGSIIELNKATEDPIDMLVNQKLVARGEVVVVDGNFAFRITEIISPAQRIQSLR